MIDVFVSYASQDRERVREIVQAIEAAGLSVWWDREIGAGTAFDREIEKAIDEAHCVVVVWSAHSVESEWVRTEANEGLGKGTLVPVAIEAVRPPLAFRRIQTIDFTAAGAAADLIGAIAKLLPTQPSDDRLPCVGRARELERIKDLVERAKHGEGALVLFSGEAGVGKTRMTIEAERIARASEMLVLRGHCPDAEAPPPYQPILEQIEQIARLVGPETMRQRMGENATELGKLMPELRQRYSDIPTFPALPPEQERRYLLHGVGEFIARGAQVMPLVLVFEDLHWADESTCILLRYLAERLKDEPVLILGTYRDGELSPGGPFGRLLQVLTRERLSEDLRLTRLGRPEIIEMLARRYASEPPAALVELIFSETEGNPFFIDEVVRHLRETGKLLTDTGKFREGIEIADTEVARGVRLIIEDRLGRAGEHCQEILTIAAVAGRAFAFDLLVKADTKHDEDDILDAVEEAEAKRLIEDVSQDRVARYRFVHEQIRQTLLSRLSLPRRQRLHLRIADALEALHGATAAKSASEIGHHLYHAGSAAEPTRTAQHLSLTGERALDALAFEDALKQLDLAASVLADGHPGPLARVQGLRSEALRGAERIPESLEALNLAVKLAPDQASRDDLTLQRCRMLLDLWRGPEALADLEQLLDRARAGGDPRHELEVQRWVARAYYVMSLDHTGFPEKARTAFERTIELAGELGADKIRGATLVATANLVDYWPDYRAQAVANLEEAEAIAAKLGDEELDIDVATARLGGGDVGLSAGEAILARLIARRDPFRLNAHYFRMMWAAFGAGAYERCAEICDAGVELAYRIGTLPVQYPTIKARALIELGRFGDATASLDREIADEAHRFGAALQATGRFQYEAAVGDFDAALERAPHVIAESHVLARAWMLGWTAVTLTDLALVYAGDVPALARIEALIADTGATLDRTARTALALARGDLAAARTEMDAKPSPLGRVSQFSRRLVELLVRARREAGEGQGAAARTTLSEAIDLARSKASIPALWRLLGERAVVEDMLSLSETAAADRAEARALATQIAASIPNPRHRSLFLGGRLAEQLGLAT